MLGLEESKIKANYGLTLFMIPNQPKLMFAIKEDYIGVVGWDDRDLWFALGDRPDLAPDVLKYETFGLTSTRSTNKEEREKFIKKVLKSLDS